MKHLLTLVAGALALAGGSASAQSPHVGKAIQTPSASMDGTAIYCDDGTGRAMLCPAPSSATNGSPAPSIGTLVMGSDGTNARVWRMDVNGYGSVLIQNPTLTTVGNTSHGAADTGSPVKIGGYASNVAPTGVPTGSRVNAWYSPSGAAVIGTGFSGTLNTANLNTNMITDVGGVGRPLAVVGGLSSGGGFIAPPGDATYGAYTQETQRSLYFAETTTALAANATYPGTSRNAGSSPSRWATFSCFAFNAGAAPAFFDLQVSDDNTNWTSVQSSTPAANSRTLLTTKVFAQYHRCVMANGPTAQTTTFIKSQFGVN